jgi:hypothetical protein
MFEPSNKLINVISANAPPNECPHRMTDYAVAQTQRPNQSLIITLLPISLHAVDNWERGWVDERGDASWSMPSNMKASLS